MNIQEMATAVVQEAPVIICLFNNYYLGMVRQMQQLFYGKRYEATCLRRRRTCPANCKGPNASCPPYTPDFIALAKSYGARDPCGKERTSRRHLMRRVPTQMPRPSLNL